MCSYTILSANLKIDYLFTSKSKRFSTRAIGYKELIEGLKPDLIGFQEYQNTMSDSLNFLDKEYKAYKVLSGNKLSNQENVLYYNSKRFKLVNKGSFWLSNKPNMKYSKYYFFEARNVTYLRLFDNCSNKTFFVACTHLDFSNPFIRSLQMKTLSNEVNKYINNDVIIIMGDFNCTSISPEFRSFIKNSPVELIDTVKDIKVPSIDFLTLLPKHSGPIDHILVSDNVKIKECTLYSNKKQDIAFSDHHPISCIFTLE